MPHLFLDTVREGYKMVVINSDLVVDKIEDNANITMVNGRLIVKGGSSAIGANTSLNFLQRNVTLTDGRKPIAWAGYKGSHFSAYSDLEPVIQKELPEHYQFLYGMMQGNPIVNAECQAWRRTHPDPTPEASDLEAMMKLAIEKARQTGLSVTVESKKYDHPVLQENNFSEDLIAAGVYTVISERTKITDQNQHASVPTRFAPSMRTHAIWTTPPEISQNIVPTEEENAASEEGSAECRMM